MLTTNRPTGLDAADSEPTVVVSAVVETTVAPEPVVAPATTAPATPVDTQPVTVPGSVRALDVLNFITVENEHQAHYNRDLFGYPSDLDGNGCDTRGEVLVRDSSIPQTDTNGCTVSAGQWHSLYDDTTSS